MEIQYGEAGELLAQWRGINMEYRNNPANDPEKKHTIRKPVRFPDDDEIQDLLDDAIPIAKKNAAAHKMELETWMLADAI